MPRKKTQNLESVSVETLIPYVNNSRTHSPDQVNQVAASIKEFGFTNPVLIDADNMIIAGHGRVQAAIKLGLTEVPCLRLDHLTDNQKKAYIIADNKLALNAGWDDELLRLELGDLDENDFDLSLTGFSDDELKNLLLPEQVNGLVDEDQVPEVPEDPVTVEGDIWILGNHRLMCGDSTSIDAVEKLMQSNKADMIFTDPPYGVDYKGIKNDNRSGLEDLLRAAFENYYLTSKSGASCYIFHSDRCADIFHSTFREFFHFSSMIIWAKNSLTLSQTDYQSQHEPCLYGWVNNGTHSFYGDRKQVSVWHFKKEKTQGHTTPKPVTLIERALTNSSKSGDIVSDLFGGSGSTMIACEKNHRSCFMMELDTKYCDVIVNRWQDFTGKEAVHEDGRKFNDLRGDDD
jgi:DNA modification methylase